jgi:hypothetical protein
LAIVLENSRWATFGAELFLVTFGFGAIYALAIELARRVNRDAPHYLGALLIVAASAAIVDTWVETDAVHAGATGCAIFLGLFIRKDIGWMLRFAVSSVSRPLSRRHR